MVQVHGAVAIPGYLHRWHARALGNLVGGLAQGTGLGRSVCRDGRGPAMECGPLWHDRSGRSMEGGRAGSGYQVGSEESSDLYARSISGLFLEQSAAKREREPDSTLGRRVPLAPGV